MKTFVEYPPEAKKTYKFKFGVAGELPKVLLTVANLFAKVCLIYMTPKKTPS